jgi:hypothetical protein
LKVVNATASLALALVFALTAALGIAAAVEAPPSIISRAERAVGLEAIVRDTRLALASCRAVKADAQRAICRAQARADERIAVAELEARYRGTIAARARVQAVQARADFSVGLARRLLPSA